MASEPKYREIERTLREEIASGRWLPNQQVPSEHELSRRFGVSYMTVRQAIAVLVADGLVRRLSGKGTFVQESRESRSTPLILVVPALWQKVDPYYFPDVLDGFHHAAATAQRDVLVTDYAAVVKDNRIPKGSAIACLLTIDDEAAIAEELKDHGFLVLGINRYTGRRNIPWLAPENMSGTAEATERLIALGHHRIAFLRGDLTNLDASDRFNGYRQSMRANGLPTMVAGSGFREENGYHAARELLTTPNPPTALVVASDLSALGAIKAARELGLDVPGDLSVIGFGNFSLLSYIDPPLTTVDLPRFRLGQRAAQMLIALANGEPIRSETLATHLVIRRTDDAPRPLADPDNDNLIATG